MENNKSGVADSVILAVAYKESRLDPTTANRTGAGVATGLMQVRGPAFKDFNMAREKEGKKPYTQEDLKDSAKNIEVGSWYLRNRIDKAKRLAKGNGREMGDGVREGLILYGPGLKNEPHYADDILAAAKEYDTARTDKEKIAALRRLHKPPKLKVPKE